MPSFELPLDIRPAEVSDLGFIRQLLTDHHLPVQDLITSPIEFLVVTEDENILGCIGIEVYGKDGFLRSFAIEKGIQNKGIGTLLYDRFIEFSKSKGIHTLHLLTTTAESYFEKKGFIKADRKVAPESIQQTTEFKGMCGSTAVYMIKTF